MFSTAVMDRQEARRRGPGQVAEVGQTASDAGDPARRQRRAGWRPEAGGRRATGATESGQTAAMPAMRPDGNAGRAGGRSRAAGRGQGSPSPPRPQRSRRSNPAPRRRSDSSLAPARALHCRACPNLIPSPGPSPASPPAVPTGGRPTPPSPANSEWRCRTPGSRCEPGRIVAATTVSLAVEWGRLRPVRAGPPTTITTITTITTVTTTGRTTRGPTTVTITARPTRNRPSRPESPSTTPPPVSRTY
jgi:hypothetical protein